MRRASLLGLAVVADACAGDPESWPHPVRLIGAGITRGERFLRRPNQAPWLQFALGAALSAAITTTTYGFTSLAISMARRASSGFGDAVELYLAWTCLAARNLHDEAAAVLAPLEAGDLLNARLRLARIVGRDTLQLDSSGISRALIETISESASDGVIAPLVYLTLGGAPLAMAYKAVNTLDSMIGHADGRYLYFGKFAARLDDAANYIPARLTALAIVASAASCGTAASSWRIWMRDGHLHKSPNAGQPEAAMAGAVQARLGGANTYGGERLDAAHIGQEFAAPASSQARLSLRLMLVSVAVASAAAVLLAWCAPAKAPRAPHSARGPRS